MGDFDMGADHGSREESRADHRLQGLPGLSKIADQPNVYLEITYKNMAAYAGDIGDQADAFEAVTEKVICNSACQNQARVHRNEIRKVLGTEVTREIIFK
jgi:hypothetical protein